jgi:sarcosine oxidase
VTESSDVVVIGGGAMGSAAAWQLARRGRDVLLLERFSPGHTMGASHGASRNFNVSYERPEYLELLVEALGQWRELEAETDSSLLDLVGMATHGGTGNFGGMRDALAAVGIPAEILPAGEAARRWGGMRFATDVLHTPQAGRINADAAVDALQRAAAARGADIPHDAHALRVEIIDDSRVRVTTADGTIAARSAVVAVGAWTSSLLSGIVRLPRLVVTQEQPAHFAVRDQTASWPGFNHIKGDTDDWWYSTVYGMFTPGAGVKAGWHGTGPIANPDARTFTPEPRQLAALQRYAREWLPGVDPDAFTDISCTYTTTPDSDFILDRVGPVTIGAGFSGHGFKFTPVIGRVLAELALRGARAHPSFSLDRFAARPGLPGDFTRR